MNALLLALAVTGQNPNYDLIAVDPPQVRRVVSASAAPPRPTIKTARGTYDDPKVTALADARAKVRAYARAMAEAQDQVSAITADIVGERVPTAEPGPPLEHDPVRYVPAPARSRSRFASSTGTPEAVGSGCYSESYSAPATTTYSSTPAATGNGCYSSAPSTSTYSSGPLIYESAPPTVTYAAAAPRVAYYSAAPVATYAAAPMVAAAPAVSTYSSSVRRGLFGRVRSSFAATSSFPTATFGAMPMATYGSGFFGASASCPSGNCGF